MRDALIFQSWKSVCSLSHISYSFTFTATPPGHFHAWDDKLITSRNLFLSRRANWRFGRFGMRAMDSNILLKMETGSRVNFIYAFPLPPFVLLHKNEPSVLLAAPLWRYCLRLRPPRENCELRIPRRALFLQWTNPALTMDHRSRISMQYQYQRAACCFLVSSESHKAACCFISPAKARAWRVAQLKSQHGMLPS